MVLGIQLVGVIFGAAMIYLAFLYYKKRDFTFNDFLVWGMVWVIFMFAVIFPQTLNVVMEAVGVISAMQLFTIAGLIFVCGIMFHLYVQVRRNQRKVAGLVKAMALAEQHERKGK
ncbi:MAG TPA: DUF2304 domain-containing protein [Candidatus Nanoarchaeia archaeon]|nr:DUF2304 domain-containing protein [Candidatus Nanoarchaeia archaeon]